MPYLPLELWLKVFQYLLPVHEIATLPNEDRETQPQPTLHFSDKEDTVLASTIQCLVSSPDLLFPSSDRRYWEVLIRNATWTIGGLSTAPVAGGYIGKLRDLIVLQEKYGVSAKSVMVIIDMNWDPKATESPLEALHDARDAAKTLRQLKTMGLCVHFNARSDAADNADAIFHAVDHGYLVDTALKSLFFDLFGSMCTPGIYRRPGYGFVDFRRKLIERGGHSDFWIRTQVDSWHAYANPRESYPTVSDDATILEDITWFCDDVLMPQSKSIERMSEPEQFENQFSEAFEALSAASWERTRNAGNLVDGLILMTRGPLLDDDERM